MSDLLERGLRWLDDQRQRHMSRVVAYHRGTDYVEIPATIGRTVFEQVDESGILERVESRDFLIASDDLVLGGVKTLPQAGDCIRETDGDRVFAYEVVAPGTEPPFRFCDPYRRTFRVHTKAVGVEAA